MEVWKWKLITGDLQLANDIVFIKSIYFYYPGSSLIAVIYSEKDSSVTDAKRFMTLSTTTTEFVKLLDFSRPFQLDGCYVKHTAGDIIIQYRNG